MNKHTTLALDDHSAGFIERQHRTASSRWCASCISGWILRPTLESS